MSVYLVKQWSAEAERIVCRESQERNFHLEIELGGNKVYICQIFLSVCQFRQVIMESYLKYKTIIISSSSNPTFLENVTVGATVIPLHNSACLL